MFPIIRRISVQAVIVTFFAFFCLTAWLAVFFLNACWLWAAIPATGLLTLAFADIRQHQHSILRNYPVVGHLRSLFEAFRPELRQYFWESDLDGKPFSRRQRSLVYQRSKESQETVAFGTQLDVGAAGHEWIAHSIYPSLFKGDLHIMIGNKQCAQPYKSSILNIGALSFGALSDAAISALNQGAKIGGFAQNTGEGGISPYHLMGGDLIWQIGTGYFGCRDAFGRFDADLFKSVAVNPLVKMIELKLSQGAKPGLGGMLPASKNTAEIAGIRNITPGTDVISPAGHTAFSNAKDMIRFVGKLRSLSDGKPVGIKLCIGSKREFREICDAIYAGNIIPDFITIDGAEGGTGAAPVEFSDHVGMPLYEAIAFAARVLREYHLEKSIRIIASGKITDGFDIIRALALGASGCYSARAMMFSLGCIQALQCHSDKCPVGIATQDRSRVHGLVASDKRVRVANYHRNTLKATVKLLEACGCEDLSEIDPANIFRKLKEGRSASYQAIYFAESEDMQSLLEVSSFN
ncbi:FMN-binding glutamate synthase family protein [Mucilaginibacter aquariorum]|uniref:FMN-binding glutamate synthase family protein n=1 Tax=Mucilaginibacter aquariorum TaxID=2967225 RepID=A0ABT1T1C7_9SPHI|nr:FMN-binding glutamate synthase family protein [Mucilaginibacter aquariorum]MCQ6958374.1 FMN-binding glutamate synthase family protein [Mucilaginibacter aquariorum]